MSRRVKDLRTRRSSYNSGLSPKTMFGPNLVQWLRADLGITTVGGLVSNWADQSGNGHHATQSVAGSRPTYMTSGGVGNGPYVFSDSVSATPWLDMTGAAGVGSSTSTGWTVAIVQTCHTITGAPGTFWSTLAATVPADGTTMQWRRDSGNRASNVMLSVTPANTFITVVTPDMNPVDTWIATVMTMSSGRVRTIRAYGDGTSGSNTDTKSTNTNIELGTGRLFRDGGTYYQNLGIQEVIMIDRDITAAELTNLQTYFRSRGLSFS